MRLLPKVCVACIFSVWISLGNASSSPYNIIHITITKHKTKSRHSSIHMNGDMSLSGMILACNQISAASQLITQNFILS